MKILTSKPINEYAIDCFDTGPIGNCPDDGGGSDGDDI